MGTHQELCDTTAFYLVKPAPYFSQHLLAL